MVSIKFSILKYIALITSALLVAMGFPGYQFPLLGIGAIIPFSLIPLILILKTLPRKYAEHSSLKKHFAQLSAAHRSLQAFFAIWFFGFILQLLAFFWISQPIIYFSSLKPYFAYPLYISICALTSLYFPILFSPLILQTWLETRHSNKKLPLIGIAMTMTLFEIIAPRFFNWTFGSLMHSETQITQISSLFGFNIISFFIFYTSLSLSEAILKLSKNKSLFISTSFINIALWSIIFTFGYFRINEVNDTLVTAKKTRIAYVQPNFTFNSIASLPLPSTGSQQQNLTRLLEMSKEAINKALEKDGKKPDLIIWPESAVHSFFMLDNNELLATKQFSASVQVPILVQATKWDKEDLKKVGYEKARVWSSSFLIRPDGSKSKEFDKWIPMPFGESVPFENYFPKIGNYYRNIFENASKVEIGTSYDALAYNEKEFVAPLICFDSIYPELTRLETLKGNASIFVNQANFVWMVNSNAGLEFSILNKFRSIENARSLVMVSNTGPTMAFDPLGRIILPPTILLTQATGFIDIPISSEITIYTLLSNWPLIILGFLSLIWILIAANKSSYDSRY
ncbi:apolipoprotein N-acyltransferase [Fluviispira multicolorata]|uniref:Apolipoprotein N-acyltransferase n=1 Tax=Fluviispira multicolorata TaxID=2654512 RepID=A0A833N155_9BACT|nr:apolipoprotein N-acyltransferase [Fluviispira multicolorata]KAB8029910.1 apolipoprotein N-acyltransferase [Fluviispira multicolorata]